MAAEQVPVRIEIPGGAVAGGAGGVQMLAFRPWELARVDGRALAAQRVTFVTDLHPGRPARRKRPVGERLRMLAVFSLPEGAGALTLRRERYALAQMVQEIATVNGRAV